MTGDESTPVTLRQYCERVFSEHEKRWTEGVAYIMGKIETLEKGIHAEIQAQQSNTAIAFTASEKAIEKAETAQREYNARSNEFRGQLDDQAKTLIGREEVNKRFDLQASTMAELRADIQTLREFKSSATTQTENGTAAGAIGRQWLTIGIMVFFSGLGAFFGLMAFLRAAK